MTVYVKILREFIIKKKKSVSYQDAIMNTQIL